MTAEELRQLVEAATAGAGATGDQGFVDVGSARVDLDRERRRGTPEVIFCPGKTPEQIAVIARALVAHGGLAYGTRCDAPAADEALKLFPGGDYDPVARTIRWGSPRPTFTTVRTAVLAAGTSDRPVAEEACATLETFGAPVDRVYDVGVAGVHRLFGASSDIERADILIVVAGMEGALPSVVGGLFRQPIIAVPTSVGYGTALSGFTALFGMLTSCASGVTVVNIDNGFGAAMAALLIAQAIERGRNPS